MPDLRNYGLLGLGILCLVLGISTWGYRTTSKANASALAMLSTSVARQNLEATTRYTNLLKQRDALQKEKDERAAKQGVTDETGKAKIADDSKRDTALVRVRVVTASCGASGGHPESQGTGSTQASSGYTGETSGVLAPEVQKLVKRDSDAVEELQLAFNSCKSTLLGK